MRLDEVIQLRQALEPYGLTSETSGSMMITRDQLASAGCDSISKVFDLIGLNGEVHKTPINIDFQTRSNGWIIRWAPYFNNNVRITYRGIARE